MHKRNAFSMIEVLVGICIFALAILPLVWLSSNQTKGAYSAGKHMMAGQLAASFMDNLLKRPYEELISLKDKFSEENRFYDVTSNPPVDSLFNLTNMIESIKSSGDNEMRSAEENIKASFKHFKYSIYFNVDDSDSKSSEKIIKIKVEVSYRVVEGDEKVRQSVTIYALKHGDRNG